MEQTSQPLVYIQTVSVPNWTNTGTTQANLDIFAFNPRTRVMYIADGTSHSVTALDTMTNSVTGWNRRSGLQSAEPHGLHYQWSGSVFHHRIDLVNKRIASQLALPGSPKLMRFNPNDGLINQAIADSDNKGKSQG